MRFARSREICVTVSLTLIPSLVYAAPVEANVAPATTPANFGSPATSSGAASAATKTAESAATTTAAPTEAGASGTVAPAPAAPAAAAPAAPVTAPGSAVAVETQPQEPSRSRPRTWQIYQRPLPGAEHSWGPPNGQMPAVVEVSETPVDPNQAPPNGTPRIIVGAIVGTLGLVVLGLGIAARTSDVFGEDRRAGVPLIGGGLVTAAVGWGLFTHGILRRRAFLRWQAGRTQVALGGAGLQLRF